MPKMLFTHSMVNPSWALTLLSNLQRKAVLGVKFTKTEATALLGLAGLKAFV